MPSSPNGKPVLLLLTNVPPSHAKEMATSLVEENLAACVTETPVTSTYRWEGAVQRDEEVTLTIKVARSTAKTTRERIIELHPYDLPEVVAVEVNEDYSSRSYVEWVREESS